MHTHTCTPTHAHLHMYTYTCTPTHAHPHMYTYTCTPTHVHMHTYTCTPTHVHPRMYTYACTPTHAHLHMHTYTCTHTCTPTHVHYVHNHLGLHLGLFLPHSEFARAFLHASDRIQARASFDHFDGSGRVLFVNPHPPLMKWTFGYLCPCSHDNQYRGSWAVL